MAADRCGGENHEDMKRTDFNYDYCKGCGVCAKVCPFKAISMVEEGIE